MTRVQKKHEFTVIHFVALIAEEPRNPRCRIQCHPLERLLLGAHSSSDIVATPSELLSLVQSLHTRCSPNLPRTSGSCYDLLPVCASHSDLLLAKEDAFSGVSFQVVKCSSLIPKKFGLRSEDWLSQTCITLGRRLFGSSDSSESKAFPYLIQDPREPSLRCMVLTVYPHLCKPLSNPMSSMQFRSKVMPSTYEEVNPVLYPATLTTLLADLLLSG